MSNQFPVSHSQPSHNSQWLQQSLSVNLTPVNSDSTNQVGILNNSAHVTIMGGNFNAIGGDFNVNASDPKSSILQWLNAPNSSKNFDDIRDNIVSGTGAWLLADPRYIEWKEHGKQLWIQGKAGAGKTFLCTTVIDHLFETSQAIQDLPPLYHYFDSRDTSKQGYRGFLLSLLAQLTLCSQEIPSEILSLYKQYQNKHQVPAFNILESTIRGVLCSWVSLAPMYIIIDAMDEASEQAQNAVTAFIQSLITLNKVYVLVTSRHLLGVEMESIIIQLHDEDINADVKVYLNNHIPQLALADDMEVKVKESLINGAHGQFRWIDCQMTTLLQCGTPWAVEETLQELPPDLETTYIEKLCCISEKQKKHAKLILQWLTYATRPPTIQELAEILATDLNSCSFQTKYRDHSLGKRLHKIVDTTLVTIQGSVVQLAHYSVKEFLVADHIKHQSAVFFKIDEKLAHGVIAHTCIIYLLYYGTQTHLHSRRPIDLQEVPLAEYAAKYWTCHGKSMGPMNEETIHSGMKLMDSAGPSFLQWLRLYQPDSLFSLSDVNISLQNLKAPLYYAAYAGLLDIVDRLIQKGADVNTQSSEYGSAFQAASGRGHEDIVKLLLFAGANVNAQGVEYGSPLYVASWEGHEVIVKLLLSAGADVDAQGGVHESALHVASGEGHEAIVKLLLSAGADVNAQSGVHESALQAASCEGNENIVKLLLSAGADVNAQGGCYQSPLQAASYKGNKNIVKLLLSADADVNAQGGEYGSALQAASWRGHEAIVKYLLSVGADVNAQGGKFTSALHAASWRGHEAIVKLLLSAGADVSAQGGGYGSPLQAASGRGHEAIVKLLLSVGADVNAKGGIYGAPLQAACLEGHEAIVKLLLSAGADVNAQGGKYGSVLYAASWRGHENIVKLLLSVGADVNAQGGKYGSALQPASWRGHEAIVKHLLSAGADVNAQGGKFTSALQAASCRGHETIVKLLLSAGADVNAQGGKYGSALQAAIIYRNTTIVQRLQSAGARL